MVTVPLCAPRWSHDLSSEMLALLPALTALRRRIQVHAQECKEMECAVATSEPASGRGHSLAQARLAQSAERKALNLVVVGSSPTVGVGATLIMRW